MAAKILVQMEFFLKELLAAAQGKHGGRGDEIGGDKGKDGREAKKMNPQRGDHTSQRAEGRKRVTGGFNARRGLSDPEVCDCS